MLLKWTLCLFSYSASQNLVCSSLGVQLFSQCLCNFKLWLQEVFFLNVYLDQGIVPLLLWKQSYEMRVNGTYKVSLPNL